MKIACILIPAIVGIITAILGYLFGKLSSKKAEPQCQEHLLELEKFKERNIILEQKNDNLQNELFAMKESWLAAEKEALELKLHSKVSFSVLGKKVKKDDLKIIKGIGPKIAKLLFENGISNWGELSEASEEKLTNILKPAGKSYLLHNHESWPSQAKMALQGKWDEQ